MQSHWLSFLAFPLTLLFMACQPTEKQNRPHYKNILILLADDHAQKVTGAYNNTIIRTPNLDQLSKEGVTFTRAYCNAPICSASRASILTGKYPHATGVNLLFTPFPDEGNITIAEHLQAQGYHTGLFGKTHFNNWIWEPLYQDGLPNHGFDTIADRGAYRKWLEKHPPTPVPDSIPIYDATTARKHFPNQMNSNCLPHPVYDKDSEGSFYTNQAIQFIRANQNNPFLAWVAFKEPHSPFHFPLEFANKYTPSNMVLPKGSPEDDRWVPEKFRMLTDEQKKGIIAAYYTSTEYMDKNIGLVLDELEQLGLEEETIVVYISDNGYLLYDHKRFEKHTMWEESVRQPLIIRMGESFRPGQREDAIVEYIDLVPTVLELLGLEPLPTVQGASFSKLLTGKKKSHKPLAFAEYLEDNLVMVCTKTWKYIFTTGRRDLGIGYQTGNGPSGVNHRLYHLLDDPGETKDLSKQPQFADTLQMMKEQMLEVFIKSHPDATRCPSNLSLEGKLVWFCEPRDIGADQSLEDIPWRVFREY